MLAQDYFSWSRQMNGLLQGERVEWAAEWRRLCHGLDPLAPADENRRPRLPTHGPLRCCAASRRGCTLFSRTFRLAGRDGWRAGVTVFPRPQEGDVSEARLAQADKGSNIAMLRARYDYYCQHIVKGFYKNHFTGFDRQIVLVDCLQPLNSGPQAFNDMRLALTQLMQSFHYGQRTLFRRLFSPVIDKLLFAATKADHITADQHANMVSLLQQLVQDAAKRRVRRHQYGLHWTGVGTGDAERHRGSSGRKIPALRGHRLNDGAPLTVFGRSAVTTAGQRVLAGGRVFILNSFGRSRWMSIGRCPISVWTPRWNFC